MNLQPAALPAEPGAGAVDALLDRVSDVKRAIATLRRHGLTPIKVSVTLSAGRATPPIIQVMTGAATTAAIVAEQATYCRFSHKERWGQYLERVHGCVVEWVERGH